ncbi:hypothetical protein CPB84DRAFT_1829122 [Gymnopilus junonius]|uniref:Uncharacterized protein n=1 Tax=Gymnopilus junonius TaxID=109634 RepID=A0A9P5TGR2_GYMJU|nr:hypothetical protein CPB84DRAFT_1829122 [Gymnopilus junonius]
MKFLYLHFFFLALIAGIFAAPLPTRENGKILSRPATTPRGPRKAPWHHHHTGSEMELKPLRHPEFEAFNAQHSSESLAMSSSSSGDVQHKKWSLRGGFGRLRNKWRNKE